MIAPDEDRCNAIIERTGKRCKAYRFAMYAWCTQHVTQAQHGHLGYDHHSLRASGTAERFQTRR